MTEPELISRTPGRPVRPVVLRQAWTDLTYVHWRYDPAVLQPLLPTGVRPDVHDGAAWVGLIPFWMRRVRVLGSPPLPWAGSFLETNVRTYGVDEHGRRGVVFLSLDANRLLPVLAARAAYQLPYLWSRMRLDRMGDEITYTCRRRWPGPRGAASRIRVRVGPVIAEPEPLADFLTARWGLHSTWWGRTAYVPVAHEAWPLHRAELLGCTDELVVAAGLPAPAGQPHVMFSPGVRVRLGVPSVRSPRRAGP